MLQYTVDKRKSAPEKGQAKLVYDVVLKGGPITAKGIISKVTPRLKTGSKAPDTIIRWYIGNLHSKDVLAASSVKATKKATKAKAKNGRKKKAAADAQAPVAVAA